jgi:hypothetical protein
MAQAEGLCYGSPALHEDRGNDPAGDIGPMKFVRVWNYSNQTLNPMKGQRGQDPPPDLDWDMYLGLRRAVST